MKITQLMYVLILPIIISCMAHTAAAQDSTRIRYDDRAHADSLADAYRQKERAKDQTRQDSDKLSSLKAERRDTRAKAKEAQRIEREATDASRASKTAFRKEKKAQRSRAQADKQSKKAENARSKSDKNQR